MPTYAFCDTLLASRLVIPELVPAEPESATSVAISLEELARRDNGTGTLGAVPAAGNFEITHPDVSAWTFRWEFPDKSAQVFRWNGPGHYRYRIDFVHGPQFYVSADGADIAYDAGFGNDDTVRHLLIDQVLPRVLSLRGALMLHAACIETPNGAIAIFGESGQGKSTLSFALQEAGCRVLSDDCARMDVLPREMDATASSTDSKVRGVEAGADTGTPPGQPGQVLATSTYPSLRLWPDVLAGLCVDPKGTIPVAGYNNKRRIDVASSIAGVAPPTSAEVVIGIILGGRIDGTAPEFAPFAKGKAMLEMVRQTFHLDVRDREVQQRSFRQIDELVRVLPTYRLAYPSGLDAMPTIARFVIERVSNCIGT